MTNFIFLKHVHNLCQNSITYGYSSDSVSLQSITTTNHNFNEYKVFSCSSYDYGHGEKYTSDSF